MTSLGVATIESHPDPEHPGRTRYQIVGSSAAVVQDAINTISATVDGAFGGVNGSAHFIGPLRLGDQWAASGVVIIEIVGIDA